LVEYGEKYVFSIFTSKNGLLSLLNVSKEFFLLSDERKKSFEVLIKSNLIELDGSCDK
jgi:hypothetical protein